MSAAPDDHTLKLLIVGSPDSGKSSILLKYTDDTFNEAYLATIGVDFKIKVVEAFGERIKLQIWDTSGEERFRSIIQAYYRDAAGIFAVFSIASRESFEAIPTYVDEIRRLSAEGVKVVLLGCQADSSDRVIEFIEASELAGSLELPYFEVSAKTGDGIEEAFMTMARMVLGRESAVKSAAKSMLVLRTRPGSQMLHAELSNLVVAEAHRLHYCL